MVTRQIKESRWPQVYHEITTYGRGAPLSLQFDLDLNCNGMDYVLKVQPEEPYKVVALQALCVYPDSGGIGGKDYELIEDNLMLSSLLELVIYQGVEYRKWL